MQQIIHSDSPGGAAKLRPLIALFEVHSVLWQVAEEGRGRLLTKVEKGREMEEEDPVAFCSVVNLG